MIKSHRFGNVKHVLFTLIKKKGRDSCRKASKCPVVMDLCSMAGISITSFHSLPLSHGRSIRLPGFCPDEATGILLFQFHHEKNLFTKVQHVYLFVHKK